MKTNIKVFDHPDFGNIRTSITETGDPLFCLVDLCKSLGLKNYPRVRQRLDSEEVSNLKLSSRSGMTTFVSESGRFGITNIISYICNVYHTQRRVTRCFAGFFMPDIIQRLCTPVWNCNGTTAFEVIDNGKDKAVSSLSIIH